MSCSITHIHIKCSVCVCVFLDAVICTILGCGGSSGVPEIGCDCFTCVSDNIKNKRTRASIHIQATSSSIIVDTSPDFRQQALQHGITDVDAILYTHEHGDHVSGIDDTKSLNRKKAPIPVFFDAESAEKIMLKFPYLFRKISDLYPQKLIANIIDGPFQVGEISIIPFKQVHGLVHSLGFRFGDLAYCTDLNELSAEMEDALTGIKVWIIDCLRYAWAPTHSYLEKTMTWVDKIRPEKAILTHMAHDLEYEELKNMLPPHIVPAFDGMQIEFNNT